ncbi:uncharacterized protein LOC125061246 isoform X2 [Pieris napi]|uniref:uncharacterized protein LOC125061246 isoform X1 n=1 Tax=Pieris napi TaxID=78633 RepID=UPI001FB9B3E5|nr:uncharacterized protein LOC125061246 isoform X1 [Pieris napi]XP_047522531.1 uncharacterized protein LOC125061246 isoform X2 [Pieris napi]
MIIRALLACLASGVLYEATAQPVECLKDCDTGYFCEEGTYVCKKCIDCAELKRETLPGAPSCIQTVADCGSCLKGLLPDLGTGIGCVSSDSQPDEGLSAYVWVAVGVALVVLFIFVGIIVVYVLRNTDTFKILACEYTTRTSVQSPCNRNGAPATAPEAPPPPYNALYSPVRPSSPPPDNTHNESWGFVKRAGSVRLGAEGRESAGSQAARVYNNPSYVRGAHLNDLPSYDVTSDDERDPIPHDEDTMESTWTPTPQVNTSSGISNGAGGELSSLLSAARHNNLVRTPHAVTQYCAAQDSNNNRSTGDAMGGEGPASSGPSFIINVVQSINAVQQQNDVKL